MHTGQHRTMLDHALQYFKIKPDFELDVMRPNQTLSSLTGRVLDTVENACQRFGPNIVLVQGDTTTAFASALAAYYCKIPVGHIEAGPAEPLQSSHTIHFPSGGESPPGFGRHRNSLRTLANSRDARYWPKAFLSTKL